MVRGFRPDAYQLGGLSVEELDHGYRDRRPSVTKVGASYVKREVATSERLHSLERVGHSSVSPRWHKGGRQAGEKTYSSPSPLPQSDHHPVVFA
jgi:hypothetical protein